MTKYYLEIYTRPTCSDCQELKEFLNKHAIAYQSHEVANNNDKEQELIKLTGNWIVPALVFKGKGLFRKTTVFTGFASNRQAIEALLKVG